MSEHPLLKSVKPDKRFYLPDGTSLSSLRELAEKIPRLSPSVFAHHVTPSKNDFHAWINAVIRDTHLSKEIKDVKDQRAMARLLSKRVAELEARDARHEIVTAISTQQTKQGQAPQRPQQRQAPRLSRQATAVSHPAPRPPQGASTPAMTPPRSSAGLKPLTTKKRHRPFSPTVPLYANETRKANRMQPPLDTTDAATRLPPSAPPGEPEGPIPIPMPPLSYYASSPTTNSLWPGSTACNHTSHLACVRCGMLEFGMGLTVGVLSALMLAKAFF